MRTLLTSLLHWRENDHAFRLTALTVFAWAGGAAVTSLILGSPFLLPGFSSPSLHLILETADACVAVLVVYLLIGRFLRDRGLRNLLLAQGLAMLPLGGFVLRFLSDAVLPDSGFVEVWLPLAVRQIGAILIVVAALLPQHLARRMVSRPAAALGWTTLLIVVLMVAGLFWIFRDSLPSQRNGGFLADGLASGHPLYTLSLAFSGACFLVASIAFATRALRIRDHLLFWLGPACALAGFARINYLLFPAETPDWLHTGDLLRTGFYVLLLIGAAKEIQRYWGARAYEAVLADRRRVARELHDGVIQELAFIRSESHALPDAAPAKEQIIRSTDRALDEARAALIALEQAGDEELGLVIYSAAREAAQRFGVELEVDLDDSIEAEPAQQHALARITREAISNAARHGHARHVRVRMFQDGARRTLVISDDGDGFDISIASERRGGYGLISMRERAHALPGDFAIASEPSRGSVVTVTW
ncbi:ATP-binding protein [Naasia sp. SYSU D00948]|uniref:sensor histidine kinase n=1 Tax=Naasia sp. SYSU D00948 TaxID=2817379 RepID=UPI001B303B88|nr:ATP-binding protein [Naasia sp. SYSU D00948]